MRNIVISLLVILSLSIIILCIISIDTTKATPTTLADTVISLSQGDTCSVGASGIYQTNSHEYRYVGAEVNNYVRFNNDLYQIIGVFDSNSTGVNGNLVKLIAANFLTSMTWGVYNTTASSGVYSDYKNDWTGSVTGVSASSNVMLNQYFLNSDTLTTGYVNQTYGACENWTYMNASSTYKNKNCNTIVGYGIKSNLSGYVETVTWYLKGFNSNEYTRRDFYNCERGITTGDATKDSNCNTGITGTADATVNAKIGLMYLSDYAYASGNIACGNTPLMNNEYEGARNWLYKGKEWTITPRSDSATHVFLINYNGFVINEYTLFAFNIRPTFYLKSSVYVTGGNGSFSNPYTIACDDCNS